MRFLDVKKCDRCGAIYSKNEGGLIVLGNGDRDDYVLLDYRGTKRYDLCHPCISAIFKWLDGACVPVAGKRGDD